MRVALGADCNNLLLDYVLQNILTHTLTSLHLNRQDLQLGKQVFCFHEVSVLVL